MREGHTQVSVSVMPLLHLRGFEGAHHDRAYNNRYNTGG